MVPVNKSTYHDSIIWISYIFFLKETLENQFWTGLAVENIIQFKIFSRGKKKNPSTPTPYSAEYNKKLAFLDFCYILSSDNNNVKVVNMLDMSASPNICQIVKRQIVYLSLFFALGFRNPLLKKAKKKKKKNIRPLWLFTHR